jgi:histidinol phosphatase-like enzyme
MLVQASQELMLDLNQSIMIGDAYTDLLAGQFAGLKQLFLVRTGRGEAQEKIPPPAELGKYSIVDTLSDAIDEIFHRTS